MRDLISRGSQGHGPVHLLLISAAELGVVWDGAEEGWVRVSLPHLRMMAGPVQHFYSSVLDARRFSVLAKPSESKGLWGAEHTDFKGSLQRLTSSHQRERDLVTSHFLWVRLAWIPSWQRQEGRCSLPFLWYKGWRWALILGAPSSMLGNCLSSLHFCPWIEGCLLWHGWLPGLSGISDGDLWASSFRDLATVFGCLPC